MGSFPALLLLLALPGSRMAGEDTQVFLQVEGESFRANCSYDMHKHLHGKKFWCKELSEKYCPVLSLTFPLEERIDLSRALHRSVDLRDSGGGWFSVTMTALRREDSGTYQCGVSVDLKQILLQRIQMVVSPKEPVVLFAKRGKSLFLHCSYSMTVHTGKLQHFIWCKMVSQNRCQPVIRGNADQSTAKAGRTEMMNDFSQKMIRVWLKKLQLNDSGEYHLESHFQGRNKLLKRITLKVLGKNWNLDASPTDDSKKDQRTFYALTVLSSLLATTALIATVTFLATSYIRRKRAGKGMASGRHSVFRKEVLQYSENKFNKQGGRKKASRMPNGESNDSTTYAAIRHQPQPNPEDVTYVNIQPSPKVFFYLQESPRNSLISGPVEYATVIPRATAPQSGIEKRKTGPPKQSSTKPSACS